MISQNFKIEKNTRSNSWSGGGAILLCPVPNCSHTGTLITKAHCRIEHELTREEVEEKFGFPFKYHPWNIK